MKTPASSRTTPAAATGILSRSTVAVVPPIRIKFAAPLTAPTNAVASIFFLLWCCHHEILVR